MTLIYLKAHLLKNKEILALLLIFILLYTFNLDKYPAVWTDEAWFINPAYALITQGIFGTTMKYGFFNIANYTYWQPPVYMLLLAASFKLLGFGLTQARTISVFLGFLTVIFTYLLGKKLYNKNIGLLASIVLISSPFFFFISREVRMDIAVTCFTLIALYFCLLAVKESRTLYYFSSGLFASISLLSHPNGVLGIISIVIIFIFSKVNFKKLKSYIKAKEIFYFFLGIILPIIPYLWYISLQFNSFTGQFISNIGNSPSSPLNNIITEPTRYMRLLLFFKTIDNTKLILFAVGIFIVLFIILGIYSMLKNRKYSDKFIFTILFVHLALFTVIISQKFAFWYLGIILPYLSILLVLIFIEYPVDFKFNKLRSNVLTLLFCGLILVNSIGIANVLIHSKDYNYYEVKDEVQKYVPNGTVVAGEPAYWIALRNNYIYYDHYGTNPESLRKLDVEYILYDDYWKNYNIDDATEIEFRKFIKDNCTLVTVIPHTNNIELGPIEVYKVNNLKSSNN